MVSVDNQVILITGAAQGIGAEVARRLHRRGAKLILTDLDQGRLDDVAAALGEDRVLAVKADVRSIEAMESAAAQGVERFGGIDVVVANAGIASYGSMLGVDPEAFKQVIDVNLCGVFNTVRAALPSILERRGYVLVVSSLAAFVAAPGMIPYDASKAATEHLANALRQEVVHRGVAVGSAHMSWVDTALVRDTKADLSAAGEMLSRLPWPLNKTTSVGECAEAFVEGIEGRKRHVYWPRWVGLFRWLKPLVGNRFSDAAIGQVAANLLPRMDAEVAALGRSTSAHTQEIEKG